jgi:hypothetical protein
MMHLKKGLTITVPNITNLEMSKSYYYLSEAPFETSTWSHLGILGGQSKKEKPPHEATYESYVDTLKQYHWF